MICLLIVKYILITLFARVHPLKIHAHSMLFILSVHYSNLLTSLLTYPSHLQHFLQAVKLRQSIYGEEHPITKRTLDLFTVIYAEMGKEQYTGTGKNKLIDNWQRDISLSLMIDKYTGIKGTLKTIKHLCLYGSVLCTTLHLTVQTWSVQHCSV